MDISPSDIDDVANYVAAITPGYVGADLALVSQEVTLQNYKRLVANIYETFLLQCVSLCIF